ncbi:MAG: T9SS type A sorting domain-containing protein [Bacteroidetes bacterium]|nr:T9SS type A sorting domain-containing protein [Bacteroidota bacterium]
MKKNLPVIFSLFSAASFAQLNTSEMAPVYTGESVPHTTTVSAETSGDRAFWTIQLDVNVLTINAGLAACYWTGTEFWVAKWSNDTLHTVSATGVVLDSFVVAGVSGTRSITSDGTNMYLGANTTDIYKVDPVTKTLTSTITTSVANCRYVTYDPTLDGGAGGFWAGSWGTDITAVSLTGTTLSAITAATHGLTGVYGMAYDGVSPSGPYLWAYDQATGTSTATLVQLSMSGTPTGLVHDTQMDLGTAPPNTGLSGGLFVANDFVPGKNTIGGINQGVSLFAYELADLAGVDENSTTHLTVYPNPATDALTLSTNAAVEQISVYSCSGQLMLTSNSTSKTIDVSSLNSGIYVVQVRTGNGIVTERFVKN